MNSVIGIDPGLSGAIAIIKKGTLSVFDMPTLEYQIAGKKKRREINIAELNRIIRASGADHAFVEAVAGMPGMGGTQMFAFGQSYGMLKAVLTLSLTPYDLVSPQKWKNYYGLSKDKDKSRKLAAEKFPQRSNMFARKKDDGRAEAALIALYGLEQSGLNVTPLNERQTNGN